MFKWSAKFQVQIICGVRDTKIRNYLKGEQKNLHGSWCSIHGLDTGAHQAPALKVQSHPCINSVVMLACSIVVHCSCLPFCFLFCILPTVMVNMLTLNLIVKNAKKDQWSGVSVPQLQLKKIVAPIHNKEKQKYTELVLNLQIHSTT
jgi:hypothetical protein